MPVPSIQIARRGPRLSRLILGLWRVADKPVKSPQQILELIQHSLLLGINTFDNADIYGDYSCEYLMGKALKSAPALRNEIKIISKCGIKLISKKRPMHRIKYYDTSKTHIVESVENSLRCLNSDTIDILLIHRPDLLMDVDEMAEALVSNQIELSVLRRKPFSDGSLDYLYQHKIAPMAWSPLAGGAVFNTSTAQTNEIKQVLHDISSGKWDAAQLLIAWLLKHPSNILPIIGTGNLERLQKIALATSIDLSREDWFRIWVAAEGEEVA